MEKQTQHNNKRLLIGLVCFNHFLFTFRLWHRLLKLAVRAWNVFRRFVVNIFGFSNSACL